jgi:type VI secretion system FHA domain protein
MYLTLEVVSPQAASLGARRRQIVGTKGLTIGRAPGNDWVIPDPYVSKQHARIVCSEGRFFVEGLGRNPIALGRADNAIPTSQPQALENGDRLFIDQYEILVAALPGDPPGEALVSGGVEAESDAGFVDSVSSTPTPAVASVEPARIPDVWDKAIVDVASETAELDPLHALGDRGSVRENTAQPVNWQQASPLDEHFKAPAPVQGEGGIPDNWARSILVPRPAALREAAAPASPAPFPLAPAQPVPPPSSSAQLNSATPVPAPAAVVRPQSAGADLVALLRAAGLPDRDLSPEVAQELGKVLRVVVHGVMDVLQGRAEIKAQFRLPHTRVQARENNPLKLSPNVESALHTLLVQRNPGYLPTVQAFEDAFADIRHHQLAMLEGLREAFGSMLGAFDPQTLERDFEQTVKRAGLLGGLSGKSRYWELYTERFGRLGRDADDTFRRLFGDVFADAYERQLERLRKEQK